MSNNNKCCHHCHCDSDPLNMGQSGLTPYIGENGNWFIGEKDTKTLAAGTNGQDGVDGNTPVIVQGSTTTLPPNTPATATIVDLGDNTYKYNFGVPKGEAGAAGAGSLTNLHIWMETKAATVAIPPSEDIFGIGTPKGIGFYSNQGSNVTDFTTAGAAVKVNSPGTYLVTYQFVVLDTKCKVCIRRKGACVEGGHIELANTGGKILVSGAMVYVVSPADITATNGAFSLANEDNTRPMPIDPKSFSWTVTQLTTKYDSTFIRIPFN